MVAPRRSRGFFNNNPGNVDRSSDVWQGEIKDANDPRVVTCAPGDTPEIRAEAAAWRAHELRDLRFVVTTTPEFGIRLLAKNLFAYRDRLGLHTISALISKWAPPSDNNDTAAYIENVGKSLGLSVYSSIDLSDYKTLYAIVDAIIRVECAGQPYSDKTMEDGLRLAGVVKPVTIAGSRTMQGAVSATVGAGGLELIDAAKVPMQTLIDNLQPLAGSNHWMDHALVVLNVTCSLMTFVGVGLMVYERFSRAKRDNAIHGDATSAPSDPSPIANVAAAGAPVATVGK